MAKLDWINAIENNRTYKGMLDDLGLEYYPKNIKILKSKITELGYKFQRKTGPCSSEDYKTDEQWIEAIKNNKTMASAIKSLGLVPRGSNYRTLKSKIAKYNLDTSHMLGQGWNTGENSKPTRKILSDSELFIKNSTRSNTAYLRKRLLAGGYKIYKCEICGLDSWMNDVIPLELHHIDGDTSNNTIENLQLICPNCHAQTDNYRGKNIKIIKKSR